MNSEDLITPPPGVAVNSSTEVNSPSTTATARQPKRHRRRGNRNRNRTRSGKGRGKSRHHPMPTHTHEAEREVVTDGTQLHQARQNHSTYDRTLHHRSQGGTGYGYRRDVTQSESELRGDQLPSAILPSYEAVLTRAGVHTPVQEESTPHTCQMDQDQDQDLIETTTLTDTQQQAWEEQQMRQAHDRDQQTDHTDADEELKG